MSGTLLGREQKSKEVVTTKQTNAHASYAKGPTSSPKFVSRLWVWNCDHERQIWLQGGGYECDLLLV